MQSGPSSVFMVNWKLLLGFLISNLWNAPQNKEKNLIQLLSTWSQNQLMKCLLLQHKFIPGPGRWGEIGQEWTFSCVVWDIGSSAVGAEGFPQKLGRGVGGQVEVDKGKKSHWELNNFPRCFNCLFMRNEIGTQGIKGLARGCPTCPSNSSVIWLNVD